MVNASARFCPFCGEPASAAWIHCAACGKRLPEKSLLWAAPSASANADPARDQYWGDAVALMREREFGRAAEILSRLLAAFPHDAEALALMGYICLRNYRIDEAGRYLEEAATASPRSIFVHVKTAEYWLTLGVPAKALEELARAEAFAEGDPALRREVKEYSAKVRSSLGGKILHQSPPPPALGFPVFLKKKPAPALSGSAE